MPDRLKKGPRFTASNFGTIDQIGTKFVFFLAHTPYKTSECRFLGQPSFYV